MPWRTACLGFSFAGLCVAACGGSQVASPAAEARAPSTAAATQPTVSLAGARLPTTPPVNPEPPRIAHDYRRIYDGWARVVFRGGRPLLVADVGAVDLSNGHILFERYFSNAAVFEGDSVWFADGFSPMSACPEPAVLVQLTGDEWLPRREANVHAMTVSAWFPGSSLAAVVPRRVGPPWGYELMVLEKNRPAPVAARAGSSRSPECHTRLSEVTALEAFASGEIFVFGTECPLLPKESEDDLGEAASEEPTEPAPEVVAESWSKGAQRSEFSTLPLRELTSSFGVGPQDIWVAGSVSESSWGLVHYDGASWTLLPERFEQEVRSLFVPATESGVNARRFYLVGKRLFEVSQGKTQEHAVPAGCEPLNVELARDALWLVCSVGEYDLALFTSDPSIAPFAFPEDPDRARVTWSERSYPPLDPKAPHGRCGPSRAEVAFPVSPKPGVGTSKVGSKPEPGRPRATPHRKTKRPVFGSDFGY